MINSVGSGNYSLNSQNTQDSSALIDYMKEAQIDLNSDGLYNTEDVAVLTNAFSNSLSGLNGIPMKECDSFYNDIVAGVIENIADQGFTINENELNKVLTEAVKLLV